MTQYPKSLLQSESQPWGRSIEQRLADLERQDRLVAQESNNNLSQINGTLDRLTQFSSITSAFSNSNTVPEPASPNWSLQAFDSSIDPSVSIVANSGRVLVTVSAVGELRVPGTGFASGFLYPEAVGVNSISINSLGLIVALGQFASSQFLGFGNSFQLLYTLSPGSYTFRARRAIETGGSSTGASFITKYRAITAQSIP